jgi:hypothetical protein
VDHWRYLRRKAYGTAEVRVLAQRVLIGDISDSRLYGRHGKEKVSRSRISAELGEISAMVKIALTDISGKEIAVGEYSSRVAELFRVAYRCKRGSSCRLMCNNLLLKPTMTVSCLDPSDVNQVTVVWLRDFQKKSYAKAFAAIKDDGSVVTWGSPDCGGDSSSIASQLQGGIVQVTGSASAFAAMKEDGSVVTWGDQDRGGDSSSVASQLQGGIVQMT